eukprot:147522-Pyramimonas_sp.AAC.1
MAPASPTTDAHGAALLAWSFVAWSSALLWGMDVGARLVQAARAHSASGMRVAIWAGSVMVPSNKYDSASDLWVVCVNMAAPTVDLICLTCVSLRPSTPVQ